MPQSASPVIPAIQTSSVEAERFAPVSDPGPWLVLSAPLCIALTWIAVAYLSRVSFG
jgi:hypothetical protein